MKKYSVVLMLVFCVFSFTRSFAQHWHHRGSDSLHHSGWDQDAQDSTFKHRTEIGVSFSNLGDCVQPLQVQLPTLPGSGWYMSSEKHSSYTLGLGFSYGLTPWLSLHLGAGFCNTSYTSDYDSRNGSSSSQNSTSSHWKGGQHIYMGSAGITRNLYHRRRTTLHAGLDLLFLLRKDFTGEYTEQDYYQGVYQGMQHNLVTGTDAFSGGVNPFVGIEFRLIHGISLGMDLSNPFLFTHVYGNQVSEGDNGGASSTVTSATDYRTTGFSNACFQVHLTCRF